MSVLVYERIVVNFRTYAFVTTPFTVSVTLLGDTMNLEKSVTERFLDCNALFLYLSY